MDADPNLRLQTYLFGNKQGLRQHWCLGWTQQAVFKRKSQEPFITASLGFSYASHGKMSPGWSKTNKNKFVKVVLRIT